MLARRFLSIAMATGAFSAPSLAAESPIVGFYICGDAAQPQSIFTVAKNDGRAYFEALVRDSADQEFMATDVCLAAHEFPEWPMQVPKAETAIAACALILSDSGSGKLFTLRRVDKNAWLEIQTYDLEAQIFGESLRWPCRLTATTGKSDSF